MTPERQDNVRKTFLAVPLALALAARTLSGGPTPAPARAAARPTEEEIAQQCLEAYWNRGDDSLFRMHGLDPSSVRSDVFLDKHLGATRVGGGKRAAYRAAIPDLKFTFLGTSRAGNVVSVRWSAEGTHRGSLGNLKATGRHLTMTGQWNVTFADSKISTFTCSWDHGGLERQMS
jgi:predicted ester cyclase